MSFFAHMMIATIAVFLGFTLCLECEAPPDASIGVAAGAIIYMMKVLIVQYDGDR